MSLLMERASQIETESRKARFARIVCITASEPASEGATRGRARTRAAGGCKSHRVRTTSRRRNDKPTRTHVTHLIMRDACEFLPVCENRTSFSRSVLLFILFLPPSPLPFLLLLHMRLFFLQFRYYITTGKNFTSYLFTIFAVSTHREREREAIFY